MHITSPIHPILTKYESPDVRTYTSTAPSRVSNSSAR